jgi:hypothetical protein
VVGQLVGPASVGRLSSHGRCGTIYTTVAVLLITVSLQQYTVSQVCYPHWYVMLGDATVLA